MNLKWLLFFHSDPFEQTGESGFRYLKEMLEAGLSPEYTKDDETLLYHNFYYHKMDYVCLLLQKDANPNHAVVVEGFKKEQVTIMEKALDRGYSDEFLELLLTYGAEYEYLRKEEWAEEDIKRLDEMAPRCYQLHDARQRGFQAFKEKRFTVAQEAFDQAAQLLQIFLDEMNAKINASNPECDKDYRNKQIYANDYQIRLDECQQKIECCNKAISTQRIAERPVEAISAQQKLELDSSARRRSDSGTSSDKTEVLESGPASWSSWFLSFFSSRNPCVPEAGGSATPPEETQPLLVADRSNPHANSTLYHRSPSK